MDWIIWTIICVGIACVFLPVKYDPAFFWVRKAHKDRYIKQARIDQKNADYPGCQEGHMECRSTVCGCNESLSCRSFIVERAKTLREQDDNI